MCQKEAQVEGENVYIRWTTVFGFFRICVPTTIVTLVVEKETYLVFISQV